MARNYRSDTTFLKHILGNGQARGFCGGGNRFFLGGGAADCKLLSSALVELLSSASLPCATPASLGCCFHFSFSSALKKLRLRLLRQKRCLLRRTATSLTYCLRAGKMKKSFDSATAGLRRTLLTGLEELVKSLADKVRYYRCKDLQAKLNQIRKNNFYHFTLQKDISTEPTALYAYTVSGLFDFVNRFQIKIKWFLRRGGYTMRRTNFFLLQGKERSFKHFLQSPERFKRGGCLCAGFQAAGTAGMSCRGTGRQHIYCIIKRRVADGNVA